MQIKKLYSVSIIILFLFSSLLVLSSSSKEDSVPTWNSNWSHKQELFLPISTESKSASFQPIDIKISFNQKCWAKNEIDHSVRVVCWDGKIWHELECQIYDLDFSSNDYIKSCGLVFLIPELANGHERYFVFYNDVKKTSPNYIDHVNVEDSYYYYEPISGVLAEGDYYKITDDGYCVYGVGQKGKVVNRKLSQCIISEKPDNKNFDALNIYHIASFGFGYQTGSQDEDEVSSEEKLISKEIITDGNLMVEFGIVSESSNGHIRTTNVYKYYYCPGDNKRIYVHVKHEVFEDCTVKGIENIDGRYGALMSYKSRSERLHRMRFGDILPYLHVSGENNDIFEYEMNLNPENNEREWIVPYTYDCDIGEKSWFSYDNGEDGISHAIIFDSNEGLIKSGTDEADGIQIKAAEKEYLDVIGAEVDYAAISFGRNSYELGGVHDLEIPGDLVIEFDAEVFTSENGYIEVEKEAEFFQTLIKYRKNGNNDLFEGDKKIYTLTVTPRFTARFFSHPLLRNLTGIKISEIRGELYQDDKLISVAYTNKPFLGPPNIKFPKIGKGEYVVKIFRRFFDFSQKYIGVKSVLIEEDTDISVFCTWQKDISIYCSDQNGNGINQVKFDLLKENTTVAENITDTSGIIRLSVPFNLFEKYKINGLYKGFLIYDQENPMFQKDIDIDLDLYDLVVKIKDKLGLVPAVDVRPRLTSSEMFISEEILPEKIGDGVYIFKGLISGNYDFQISYGSFKDIKNIEVSGSDISIDVDFSAEYDLGIELFDLRGNPINHAGKTIKISRNGKTVCNNYDSSQTLFLPPGEYKVDVYSNGKHVGIKNFKLITNQKIKIVTSVKSIIPVLISAFSKINCYVINTTVIISTMVGFKCNKFKSICRKKY